MGHWDISPADIQSSSVTHGGNPHLAFPQKSTGEPTEEEVRGVVSWTILQCILASLKRCLRGNRMRVHSVTCSTASLR